MECLPRKTWLQVEMSYNPTAYDFKGDLFLFSDEEGGAPFRLDHDDKLIGRDQGLPVTIGEAFSISPEGFIDGLQDGTNLAFLGDLVDNSIYSFRVLKAMVDLKNTYADRVLLISGNRDFNKIRMGIELFLQAEDGTLPWTGVTTVPDMIARLASNKFTFRKMDTPTYLKNVGTWNSLAAELDSVYSSGDILKRVSLMFTKTLGIARGELDQIEEINALFPGANLNFVSDPLKAVKTLCAIQMVMSFMWTSEEIPIPELHPYIGLYPKYLNRSHVIALFNYYGEMGVMSHAGIPQTFLDPKTGSMNKHALTSPFGFFYQTPKFNPGGLRTIISRIEDEKTRLVNALEIVKTDGYTNDALSDINTSIDKFIHLTALTTLSNGASSLDSPIVGFQPIATEARQDILVQLGGGWIEADLAAEGEKLYVNEGTDVIAYNIYGHAPQGFLPTAFRHDKTLHVCLDVSKIEGQTNNYSYAMLHMKPEANPQFIGRILFPPQGPLNQYDAISKMYADRVVYYTHELPKGVPISFLKGTMIPGTSVIMKSVMINGSYGKQFTSIGGGRRRTLRRRARARKTRSRLRSRQ